MEKTKILLISDLHLGMERVNSLISGEERLSTLRRIISLAQKHDILLIAGDLIHDADIDRSYFNIINEEFATLVDAGIEIFYTPGPGELISNGKLNPMVSDISTTYTFSDEKSDLMVKSSKGDIFIYGQQSKSLNKEWNISRSGHKGFHIGLFHSDFNPQVSGNSDTDCIKKDDIKKMNLDFYALGKNHTFKMFRFSNKILGAYPGSAEPCSIDESGDRFAVSMEVEDNVLLNIKRIAVNTGKILSDEIDCGTIINQNTLLDKIKSTYPDKSIVNITLIGERDFLLENNFQAELAEYFRGLKISDTSLPSLKVMIDENINHPSLKGMFFKVLSERLHKTASDKIKNEILAEIISRKNISGKSEGAVLCDF
jgi:DNA repair exonuclease SbcCD nuclease subunit